MGERIIAKHKEKLQHKKLDLHRATGGFGSKEKTFLVLVQCANVCKKILCNTTEQEEEISQ